MKIDIPFFPMITNSLKAAAGVAAGEFTFTYQVEGEEKNLTLEPVKLATEDKASSYNLVDEQGIWDPITRCTYLSRCIRVANPQKLFGPSGVACRDAVLGVALQVVSLTSNHRFSYPILDMTAKSGPITETICVKLPADFYREKLILRTIFYIKEAGQPESKEINLANQSGMMLGNIDEVVVFIDGTGSAFPIKHEVAPGKTLWRVECNWDDVFHDQFTVDNVCIVINEAHKYYSMVKADKGLKNAAFLIDIIASAMQIIISKAISSCSGLDELLYDDAAPGSVADAVRYFIKTFGWNATSPELLAESIRTDFDRRITND